MRIFYIWFHSRSFPDYPKIAAVLRARGHSAWVAGYDEQGDIEWREGEKRVAKVAGHKRVPPKLKKIPLLRPLWLWISYFLFMVRLRRFLRREQPDIVHVCPNSVRMIWLLPLFMPRQMRFVIDYRQIGQREGRRLLGKLKSAILNGVRPIYCRFFFDHATFLHEAGAEKVLGKQWRRWATVVPLGVDTPFLRYDLPAVAPANGNGNGHGGNGHQQEKRRFLYLGSIVQVRKLEEILRAAQQMSRTTTDFQLDFIGPDLTEGYYHQMVNELGIDHVVTLRPPVPYDTVPATVANYDVALAITPEIPSDWQYQPTIKIMEYRALGMPIIASDFLPNREIVEHEVNGLLINNSVNSISQAMLNFIQDPAFYRQCRTNAQPMRQALTWDKIVDMYWRDVYQKLSK
jgi:glycosyltransferase involved in cell wall biosynthesis